jgi:hypothetical protein
MSFEIIAVAAPTANLSLNPDASPAALTRRPLGARGVYGWLVRFLESPASAGHQSPAGFSPALGTGFEISVLLNYGFVPPAP